MTTLDNTAPLRDKSKELETLNATVLVFGALTALLFTFFIRPMFRHIPSAAATTTTTTSATNGSSFTHDTPLVARLPSHVVPSAQQSSPSSLLDTETWMISWQHCRVSLVTRTDETMIRRERATLLSRLGTEMNNTNTNTAVAKKGSTVVLGILSADLQHWTHHVYLLATYYNLIVLVATKEDETRASVLKRLRAAESPLMTLTTDVLPDHRVVRTGSASGRVAFCRQLQRADWVLDFDPEVKEQLGRFGHRVVLYQRDDFRAEK